MSLIKKIEEAGKWTLPIFNKPDLEEQLKKAKEYDGIKEILNNAKDEREYSLLERRLKDNIDVVNKENSNLYNFAKLVDTYDKALVPIDVAADYMKIVGGVGYGISAAKELVEAPVKLAYSSYYLGKTKDLMGFLGNIIYEGLSFFLPGSLLDLTNHYLKQADKYTVKTAVDRFVEYVKRKKTQKEEQKDIREEKESRELLHS